MRHEGLKCIFLKGDRRLFQQELPVREPEDLFLFIQGIGDQPGGCRIGLAAPRREDDQGTVPFFLIDDVQICDRVPLMLV